MLKFLAVSLLLCALAAAAPLSPMTITRLGTNETAKEAWLWNKARTEDAREFSRSAYCDASTLTNWQCESCKDEPDFVVEKVIDEKSNPDRLQGFIGYSTSKKLIIVSFRGSVNLANFIADLKFDKVDSDFNDRGCTDCKIHRGFYEAYAEISPQITGVVNDLAARFPDYIILTTGHSLGGAMAVHAALDLCINHNLAHRLDMITFGQPRLGNEEFALFCASVVPQGTRIVHENDIVPHLPFKDGLLPFDFHHNAREVWNTDDLETVKMCDDSGEDPSCSKGVSVLRYSVPDHLWYFGKPHGCDKGAYTVAQLEEFQHIQNSIVQEMVAAGMK